VLVTFLTWMVLAKKIAVESIVLFPIPTHFSTYISSFFARSATMGGTANRRFTSFRMDLLHIDFCMCEARMKAGEWINFASHENFFAIQKCK